MDSSIQQLLSPLGMTSDYTRPLTIAGLIMIRLLTAFSLTPYIGMKPVPHTVRAATAMAFTAFTYPLIAPGIDSSQIPRSVFLFLALFIKEVLFGVLLGLVNIMIFFGIQSAGNMIDNQRSVANARIFNPALGAQASLFGMFFYQMVIASFVGLNLHLHFIKAVIESFIKVPILYFPHIEPGISPLIIFIIKLSADTLIICLQISAPVLIAIFIADLVLGITNRIAPMINVFEMGFNIKGFVGVLLVFLALPVLFRQSEFWFQQMRLYWARIIDFFLFTPP